MEVRVTKAGQKLLRAAKEAVDVAKGTRKAKATVYSTLDVKKHGVGGIISGFIREKKQDKKARATELYMVVFFPKITRLGPAQIWHSKAVDTLSQSPEAAKVKFMDHMAPGQKWRDYEQAGWRIRKVRINDLGDA
jgi:hypothetical protein